MKKIIIISLLLISINISMMAQILDKTIAVVTLYKTENISQSRLDQQIELWKKQTQQDPDKAARQSILDATINDILISQAAKKSGIVATNQQVDATIEQQKKALGTPISDADLKEFIIAQSGLSWEEYRSQIKNRIVQEQYIYSKYSKELQEVSEPTEREIEQSYDLYSTEFTNPNMVRVEHIFWDTRSSNETSKKNKEKKAQAASKEIGSSNKAFDSYLKKSLDDISVEGGDLGYVVRDESTYRVLGKDFLDSIFDLEENQVSKVLVSSLGYHIVKVTDVRKAKLLELQDPIFPGEKTTVKDRVKQALVAQQAQEKFLDLVQKEVDSLREDANIRIIDKSF